MNARLVGFPFRQGLVSEMKLYFADYTLAEEIDGLARAGHPETLERRSTYDHTFCSNVQSHA